MPQDRTINLNPMPHPANFFLFAALPCEAKPIIAHFALRKEPLFHQFAIYRNADYCLTVTGPGKAAMAAAVAYTLALIGSERYPIVLNIGIAGHRDHALGKIFIAEKITDADSEKNFYPPLAYETPCATAPCYTVAKPYLHYRPDYLFDMEASAFYETAVRFTSSELVQCMKVVSDNAQAPATNIRPEQVSRWLSGSIETLEKLIRAIDSLAQLLDSGDCQCYEAFTRTWRFSVSERIKLRNLLLRYSALTNGKQPEFDPSYLKRGKDVLVKLEQELAAIDFRL